MVFHIADDYFAETFRIFVLRTTQKLAYDKLDLVGADSTPR